mmetsp:Transcript_9971/g.17069  ORF Transcript_9971/g.17069 Transcript_9971/m.17069 type:complete len:216 (+) Transcript_9971:219-866(+)
MHGLISFNTPHLASHSLTDHQRSHDRDHPSWTLLPARSLCAMRFRSRAPACFAALSRRRRHLASEQAHGQAETRSSVRASHTLRLGCPRSALAELPTRLDLLRSRRIHLLRLLRSLSWGGPRHGVQRRAVRVVPVHADERVLAGVAGAFVSRNLAHGRLLRRCHLGSTGAALLATDEYDRHGDDDEHEGHGADDGAGDAAAVAAGPSGGRGRRVH